MLSITSTVSYKLIFNITKYLIFFLWRNKGHLRLVITITSFQLSQSAATTFLISIPNIILSFLTFQIILPCALHT